MAMNKRSTKEVSIGAQGIMIEQLDCILAAQGKSANAQVNPAG